MKQEAANKLDGIQRHPLLPVAVSRVSPAESHLAVLHFQQASVRNGDAMGVASEVLDDVLRTSKWRFGVDNPMQTAQSNQETVEFGRISQVGQRAKQMQLAFPVCRREEGQEFSTK
jgi:hypothetical protein